MEQFPESYSPSHGWFKLLQFNVFKNGLQKLRSSRMRFFYGNWCLPTPGSCFRLQTRIMQRHCTW